MRTLCISEGRYSSVYSGPPLGHRSRNVLYHNSGRGRKILWELVNHTKLNGNKQFSHGHFVMFSADDVTSVNAIDSGTINRYRRAPEKCTYDGSSVKVSIQVVYTENNDS